VYRPTPGADSVHSGRSEIPVPRSDRPSAPPPAKRALVTMYPTAVTQYMDVVSTAEKDRLDRAWAKV